MGENPNRFVGLESTEGENCQVGLTECPYCSRYPSSHHVKHLLHGELIAYHWFILLFVFRHGVRNSLLLAPMPTASTAQILGNNESIEAYTSNIYTRRVLSGEFQVSSVWVLSLFLCLQGCLSVAKLQFVPSAPPTDSEPSPSEGPNRKRIVEWGDEEQADCP